MASAEASGSAASIAPPHGLQRLIIDVRSHQLPRLLGQDRGESDSISDDEYSAAERELNDTQRRIDALLADWAMDAVDMGETAREREAYARAVKQTTDDVARLKREAQQTLLDGHRLRQERRANQKAMHWRDQHQSSREALFGDMASTRGERDKRRDGRLADQTSDDKLMTASGDVTAALQRTVKLMSAELEKSSYSAQLLDESTVSVQQATVQYTSFSDLVSSSRKLIASMERADLVDAMFLGLSMLFFACCILYILKVRIWDRGIGILSFLSRLVGVTRGGRSVKDVTEKLRMASQAAKRESVAASMEQAKKVASEASAAATASLAASLASAASAANVASSAPTPDEPLIATPPSTLNEEPIGLHDEL